MVTSLLTLYAIGRVWNRRSGARPDCEIRWQTAAQPDAAAALMVAATLALVVLGTGLTVVSGPLIEVTTRAAADLLGREPYVRAVFGRESP